MRELWELFPKTNGVSECWNYFSEAKKDDKFFLDGLFVRVVLLPFCTKLKMETILISTEQKIFQIT